VTFLLDTNLLIALAWPQHVHHALAHHWFRERGRSDWATCPLTQLAFVRISSNPQIVAAAVPSRAAVAVLRQMTGLPGHRFWPDDVPPVEAGTLATVALVGHRQVTDAYLVALAEAHGGMLATLDRGIVDLAHGRGERQVVEVVG
jgi:hypothetical protein